MSNPAIVFRYCVFLLSTISVMNDYYAIKVHVSDGCTPDYTDLLAAYLADIDYESFEPDDNSLTAYIKAELFDIEKVRAAISDLPISLPTKVSYEFIEGKDWNEEWEKNYFQPIVIGDKCVIHSTFHNHVPDALYDIVIDPKMAFGTGHHFTTRLILSYLLDMDLHGKSVIDVGTGTGILAILAKMRGASRVDAIEIDPPAYENACEHTTLNKVDINVILGDASSLSQLSPADIIIANINRNVIMNDIATYVTRLEPGGTMILSGFYKHDIPVLMEVASPLGLSLQSRRVENDWTAISLQYF